MDTRRYPLVRRVSGLPAAEDEPAAGGKDSTELDQRAELGLGKLHRVHGQTGMLLTLSAVHSPQAQLPCGFDSRHPLYTRKTLPYIRIGRHFPI